MRVVYSDRVRRELDELEAYVAGDAGPLTAERYLARIVAALDRLAAMPERCALWPELGVGTRVLIVEGRVSVAFRIRAQDVELLALFGAGRDLSEEGPLP